MHFLRDSSTICLYILSLILLDQMLFAEQQISMLDVPPTDNSAWQHLPPAEKGGGKPLPMWARQLAQDLPKSTAALLQLDYAHREASPLPAKLRTGMRYVAAHSNSSAYAQSVALEDLKRRGVSDELIQGLGSFDYSQWSPSEQAALEFARKMTVASESVTDEEFARLVADFGEKQAACMVLLMAYSNFQDRLLICLQTPFDPKIDGIPAPHIQFAMAGLLPTAPPSTSVPPAKEPLPKPTGKDLITDDADWTQISYAELQTRLENQRQRETRLPILDWSVIAKNLQPGLFRGPSDIIWYRIVFGYAPELATPYEIFMRTAGAETAPDYDRIFGQSLFWITTRAIGCPYCMGHCEMNWEVAGLTPEEIAQRSRLLSGSDWSSFPEREQLAFAFARKLTKSPGSITPSDLEGLRQAFGEKKALIVMLHASRHHYMTRISNGFQLTLERENVFYDYWNVKRPAQ